jgi:hypothetical protein
VAIESYLGHFRLFNQRIHARCLEARGIKEIVSGSNILSLTLIFVSLLAGSVFIFRQPQKGC